jgi:hypothetical protein
MLAASRRGTGSLSVFIRPASPAPARRTEPINKLEGEANALLLLARAGVVLRRG